MSVMRYFYNLFEALLFLIELIYGACDLQQVI